VFVHISNDYFIVPANKISKVFLIQVDKKFERLIDKKELL